MARGRDWKDRVWDYVYDGESLNSDQAAARDLADRVKTQLQYAERAERWSYATHLASMLGRAMAVVGIVLGIGLACAGLAYGIYWSTTWNNGDYAGYGPSKVDGHGRDALLSYFGQNDAPEHLLLVRKEHALLGGEKTWKVDYRTGDGQLACAWVWIGDAVPGATEISNGNDGPNYYRAGVGATCRT